MSNHPNRGRIIVLPLDSTYRKYHHKVMSDALARHNGWIAEAMIEDGLLIRSKASGLLAIFRGDRIVSVDQKRAETALAATAV